MTLGSTLIDIKERILGREGEEDVTTTPEPSSTTVESIPVRPTKTAVLDAIMAETECTRSQAGNVLAWAKRIVRTCRQQDYAPYLPTTAEMRGTTYQHLDAIMQHGQTANPGSAHALLEAYVLDPSKDETGLLHDNTADVPGTASYCKIQVGIGVIR